MKYSKQREMILNYLRSVTSHPTAEQIYTEICKDYPDISLGTVYRNLDKLTLSGEITRIEMANDKDRFDYNKDYHYHALCIKCGKVIDIYIDYFSDIDRKVKESINCDILSHNLLFNAICQECNKK